MSRNSNPIQDFKDQVRELERSNRLSEAKTLLEQLCQMTPEDSSVWVGLGAILRRQHAFDEAEKSCRRAIALQSDYAAAHHGLGAILQQQGRLNEALSCYREAVRLDPDYVDAHYFLANVLRQSGRLEEATTAYRRLLELSPDHFPGLNNLGAHLKNMGDTEGSIALLKRALQLQPDSVETMTNLGDAYVARSRIEQAMDILQRAIKTRPDFANAHRAYGNALHHAGRLREALNSYAQALQLVPGWREVIVAQAKILEQLGKYTESYKLLQPLISAGFDGAIPVFFDISKHVGKRKEAARKLERFLDERPDMRAAAAAGIHFQLGGYYDEIGNYDTAFTHFRKANAKTPADFNSDAQADQVEQLISTYDSEFVQCMQCAEIRSDLPVFIVGMPRSGTSLVEQILASHPRVFGAGELPHISRIAQRLSSEYPGLKFPELAKYVTRTSLDSAASRHLGELKAIGGGASRVTDKMPYNLVYVGLIAQLFPEARIIQCVRHPLDTCLSCFFSDFGSAGHGFSYDLKTVGEFYIGYHRLMQHWENVLSDHVLQVSYSELVREQERFSRKIVEFCGLEWDKHCLDFHTTERLIFTLSYDQVRQPMYTRSLDRWRNYRQYLQPLRDQLEAAGICCD